VPAPIRDLALLSDCQSAALVTRDGTVAWWPAPRFDSPSVFSAVLDEHAGHWSVRPAGRFDAQRRYLPGTLVVETTMRGASGALRLTDALALAPGARGHEIGHEVPCALLRVVEAVGAEVEVELDCVPRPEYGLAVPRLVETEDGVATLGGPERLFLRGTGPLVAEGASAHARLTLRAGERAGWALQRAPGMCAAPPARLDPYAALEDTITAWRSWADLHQGYDGCHRDEVHHAGLVIQGLTYQPTGAVVAAPTTSLPELMGGDANFDYRYAWLRDAAMIGRALSSSTCSDEAIRYFGWMTRAATACRDDDHVQIVFGVDGERDLTEHRLEHLDGHGASRPVRVGNAAWRQKQLDVLGHVLDCAWVIRDEIGTPDDFTGEFLCQLADRAAGQWREPDSSIWEGREGERDYVVSKVLCWAALDRASGLADRLGGRARPGPWRQEADTIRATVLREAWHAGRGAYTGAFGSPHLDAGVLMLPLVGVVEPGDPRMARTVAALEEELGDDGLLRRWTGADDGAFLLASFWLAEYHAREGNRPCARGLRARGSGGQRRRTAGRGGRRGDGRAAREHAAGHRARRARQRRRRADRGRSEAGDRMTVRSRLTEAVRGQGRARPAGLTPLPPLVLAPDKAVELSRLWRARRTDALWRRRRVVAAYLLASGSMGMISAYQSGVVPRLPELPVPGFDAPRVDSSAEAYQLLGMPDGVLALVSNAVTMALTVAGGEHPPRWLRSLAAAKACVDAAYATKLTVDQATKHRAACSWCLLATAATFSALPHALRGAR
jgi:GH15 family glucan-1,4-alpha-glucosidase